MRLRLSRRSCCTCFVALDVDLIADMGAYLSQFAPYIPYLGAVLSPGVYDIPACHIRVRGVHTNTAS